MIYDRLLIKELIREPRGTIRQKTRFGEKMSPWKKFLPVALAIFILAACTPPTMTTTPTTSAVTSTPTWVPTSSTPLSWWLTHEFKSPTPTSQVDTIFFGTPVPPEMVGEIFDSTKGIICFMEDGTTTIAPFESEIVGNPQICGYQSRDGSWIFAVTKVTSGSTGIAVKGSKNKVVVTTKGRVDGTQTFHYMETVPQDFQNWATTMRVAAAEGRIHFPLSGNIAIFWP